MTTDTAGAAAANGLAQMRGLVALDRSKRSRRDGTDRRDTSTAASLIRGQARGRRHVGSGSIHGLVRMVDPAVIRDQDAGDSLAIRRWCRSIGALGFNDIKGDTPDLFHNRDSRVNLGLRFVNVNHDHVHAVGVVADVVHTLLDTEHNRLFEAPGRRLVLPRCAGDTTVVQDQERLVTEERQVQLLGHSGTREGRIEQSGKVECRADSFFRFSPLRKKKNC